MGESRLTVRICGEQRRKEALGLVLRTLPADQRAPLVAALGRLRDEVLGPFDALVGAFDGDRLVAAAWGQPHPGKTASLWLPVADGVDPREVATRLIAAVVRRADELGVEITQVLLEPAGDPLEAPLLECGFRSIAELEYLAWSPGGSPRIAETPVDSLTFVSAEQIDQRRLNQLVSRTYTDTLDCPEMDGVRNVEDVLDGYRCTGDHDPALWFVAQHRGADAGALLLSEHRSSRQMELTYMGVVPEARGNRIGQAAVAAAQHAAVDRACEQLVLAVDTRNRPAKAIYAQAGFVAWAARRVWIRQAHAN